MGYGFAITRGDKNEKLADGLMKAVAEIRVEETLSGPASFAVRFEEDICEGMPATLSAKEIMPGEMLAVLVPDENDQATCLVRGPITKVKASAVTGGPGSWVETHGLDRRIEMDRKSIDASWTGPGTDIATKVLEDYKFKPDVLADQSVQFSEKTKTFNQCFPDLKLMDALAKQLAYEFWLTYETEAKGAGYKITETARFRPSPDFKAPKGAAPSIEMINGKGAAKVLKLDVPAGKCRNISTFDLEVDVERATLALIAGIDGRTGKKEEKKETDKCECVDKGADTKVEEFGKVARTMRIVGAGSAEERGGAAKALLAAEAWFITAKASTSVRLLPGLLRPHDIVRVEGHGFAHSGNYQVSKVVHVINAWGHLMDLTLRRNVLPSPSHV